MIKNELELLESIKTLFKGRKLSPRMKEEILELIEFKVVIDELGIKANDVKDLTLIMAKSYQLGQKNMADFFNKTLDETLKDFEEKAKEENERN